MSRRQRSIDYLSIPNGQEIINGVATKLRNWRWWTARWTGPATRDLDDVNGSPAPGSLEKTRRATQIPAIKIAEERQRCPLKYIVWVSEVGERHVRGKEQNREEDCRPATKDLLKPPVFASMKTSFSDYRQSITTSTIHRCSKKSQLAEASRGTREPPDYPHLRSLLHRCRPHPHRFLHRLRRSRLRANHHRQYHQRRRLPAYHHRCLRSPPRRGQWPALYWRSRRTRTPCARALCPRQSTESGTGRRGREGSANVWPRGS